MKNDNTNKLQFLFIILMTTCAACITSCNKFGITEPAELILSDDTIVFEGNVTKVLNLSTEMTEGCPFRVFHANMSPYWVDVEPNNGTIEYGQDFPLTLTSHFDTVLFGPLMEELEIWTTKNTYLVHLIGIPDDRLTYSVPDTLFFPGGVDEIPLIIKNTGNVPITYSLTSTSSYTNLSSTSGEVQTSETAEIRVGIDRDNILSESDPKLIVNINGNDIPIAFFIEKKMMLGMEVIDAEYSKATDLLVFITKDAALNIYYPDTKLIETIPLVYYPISVSLSNDGTKAAVGQDAHVTYIDLMTKTILNTVDISCRAYDIVLGDNGWAYVFPSSDNNIDHFRSIDLSVPNATEILSTTIISNFVKAKAHPSGKYMYITRWDFTKYNIQEGPATYLYDSPDYESGISTNGVLWLSEEGDLILCKSACVFKTSEDQSTDMEYVGKLKNEDMSYYDNIAWIDHSAISGNIFTIRSWTNTNAYGMTLPYVFVNNDESLSFKYKLPLEYYTVCENDGSANHYKPIPLFVFSNSNGEEVYVITKSFHSSLTNDYAIQTLQVH